MKFKKEQFYSFFLMIILLSQIYIPSFKFNILLQITSLFVIVYNEKIRVKKSFITNILPLFLLLAIGFVGFIVFQRSFSLAIKDTFHIIKPLLGITLGYIVFKLINDKKVFYKIILKTAFISAIIHLFIILFFTKFLTFNISAIRQFTRDNFLELFALFIYYYLTRKEKVTFFGNKEKRYINVIIISCVLYFSRTMMITTIILFLSILGYTRITQKTIKGVGFVLLSIGVFYLYLFNTNIKRSGTGVEGFLYKVKIAPAEIFKTKIDRENHKDLWDHWRGYEAKRAIALLNDSPVQYVFGAGYGSLVNLKFKAPLDSDNKGMKFISELHNGYVYILYKLGVIGVFFYVFFLINNYIKIYGSPIFENIFISAIAIFFLFTTLTITGVFNSNDTIIFLLGAMYSSKNEVTKEKL